MKRFRFLTASLAGTLLYVVISLFGGQNGLWASQQMLEQKRILSTHTAEIQRIHDRLDLEYTALEQDPDVISAYARKLGYVSDGEKLVKISGLASSVDEIYDTGKIQKPSDLQYLPEWVCKLLSLAIGMLVFIMLLLNDKRKGLFEKRNRPIIKGIPVYDVSQI
jgi:cell division protein FtsB